MVITLLSIRWLSFRNGLVRASNQERKRARTNLLFSLLVVGGIAVMSYGFLSPFVELAASEPSVEKVLARLPSFAFFAAFWMLLLSGVTVGIQRFYLNQELNLLLSAPLAPRAVFVAKFVEATLANAGLFLTIGAPILLAYGLSRGIITGGYIVQLVAALTAFSALPTGLGLILAFALMRVLPSGRMRDLLGALGILAFALLYFMMSIGASRAHDAEALRETTTRLAGALASPVYQHGPWAWAGTALGGQAAPAPSWAAVAMLTVLACAAVLLTSLSARWLHWRGWAKAQEAAQAGSRPVRSAEEWERRLSLLPGPIRAVFLKDFRSLGRDLRQLSLLFIPIAVVAVFLVHIADTETRRVPPLVLILGLYPVLAMIALRLAMSGFVAENRALWLVMAAPSDARALLMAKLLYSFALSLPLGGVATLGYCMLRELDGTQTLMSLALSTCVMSAFCGLGVGASAVFSDFSADNPRFTVSTAGRLVTFVVQMIYLTVLGALVIVAWSLAGSNSALAPVMPGAAALAVLTLSGACVLGPIHIAARRLRRLEW